MEMKIFKIFGLGWGWGRGQGKRWGRRWGWRWGSGRGRGRGQGRGQGWGRGRLGTVINRQRRMEEQTDFPRQILFQMLLTIL